MWEAGWTASSCSRVGLRRPHDVAAEPAVLRHLGLERDDPLRPLRVARHLVGERELMAQPDGPGHADTVGLTCHGPGRPHHRGRRRRRPLRRALRRSRGRAGDPHLRPPAGRDRLLLGAGRAGGRAGRGRLARAAPAGHDRRRPRHRAHARRRASSPRRRPRASATSRRSASASTPTATATWRSGSRAAIRAAASPTPAAAPTGRRILRELSAAVSEHPNIDVRESRRATGLRLSDQRAPASTPTTAARSPPAP